MQQATVTTIYKIELIQVSISLDNIQELIQFLKPKIQGYIFGSLIVKVVDDPQFPSDFNRKFSKIFQLSDYTNYGQQYNDFIFTNDFDIPLELFFEALKQSVDLNTMTMNFLKEFNTIFDVNQKIGSIKVPPSDEQKFQTQLFAVKYAQLMQNASGMTVYIPKFQPGRRSEINKLEIMKFFSVCYPAYHILCRNNRIKQKFLWNYQIDDHHGNN